MRHYRLATGQGKRLAVERGDEVRRALDEGLSEDEIRARYRGESERGLIGSSQRFGASGDRWGIGVVRFAPRSLS
jgi:hypothetical protein